MPFDSKTVTVFVEDDAFIFGRHWEDGIERVESSYYVVAEQDDGRRWAHVRRFRLEHSCAVAGCHARVDPDADTRHEFCDAWERQPYKTSGEAREAAARFLEVLRKEQAAAVWSGPWLNPEWQEIRSLIRCSKSSDLTRHPGHSRAWLFRSA